MATLSQPQPSDVAGANDVCHKTTDTVTTGLAAGSATITASSEAVNGSSTRSTAGGEDSNNATLRQQQPLKANNTGAPTTMTAPGNGVRGGARGAIRGNAAAQAGAQQPGANAPAHPLDKYRVVPRTKTPIKDDEIRIACDGKLPRYVTYAARLFAEENRKSITIKATGNAICVAITLAEIVKRRFANLHQFNRIGVTTICDTFEPLEEGLEEVVRERDVPFLELVLTSEPETLDMQSSGYQPPIDQTLVKNMPVEDIVAARSRGGRGGYRGRRRSVTTGRGGARGRGGRGGPGAPAGGAPAGNYAEDYQQPNQNRGSGYVRGGGYYRGRGGRGGARQQAPRDGQEPQQSVAVAPNMIQTPVAPVQH